MISGRFKPILFKYWHWPVVISLAICFFIATSSFNYFLQKDDFVKWISPDETANFIFSKLYAQEHTLQIFERYNLYVQDIIHPRSIRSDHGMMKPVSFIGLPFIFGSIGSVFGYKVLPYLTPFFGSVAIIFFYLLIRKMFGRRNAVFSSFLLAFFPVFAYYSARSMFHNVLFISLLLIGLYYVLLIGEERKKIINQKFDWRGFLYAMLGGVFIGLAAITRTSELLWLGPMLLLLWIFSIKNVGIFKLVVFVSFLSASFLPALYWNQILYGGAANSGYPEMNQSIYNIKSISADLVKMTFKEKSTAYTELVRKLKSNIFYFGFHPGDAGLMYKNYFIVMFSWLFWPSVIGLVSFLSSWRRFKKRHYLYLVAYFLTSLILVLYYGSWRFNDNPELNQITIGNSYTRYWLPVYLGAMPFFSHLVLKLTDFKKRDDMPILKRWKQNLRACMIFSSRSAVLALVFFICINFIMRGSSEGLEITFKKQKEAKHGLDRIIALTEKNATIITRYHDKLFFPERKVVIGLFDDKKMISLYAALAAKLPVYYYNFTLPYADFEYLNSKKLAEAGLRLSRIEQITPEFTLYKLEPVNRGMNAIPSDKKQ